MHDKELIQKTIKLEQETIDKINEMRKETQRDFAKQVRFMLSEYIRIKENK